jgi:putative flippase GtrA
MSAQFATFLLTGATAAAVNLLARYVFNFVVTFEMAVVLAYPFGLLTAYLLAKLFVFKQSSLAPGTEVFRFTLVNIMSLVFVWSVSVACARIILPAIGWVWHANEIAHLVGVAAPAVFAFFAHRDYTFQRVGEK